MLWMSRVFEISSWKCVVLFSFLWVPTQISETLGKKQTGFDFKCNFFNLLTWRMCETSDRSKRILKDSENMNYVFATRVRKKKVQAKDAEKEIYESELMSLLQKQQFFPSLSLLKNDAKENLKKRKNRWSEVFGESNKDCIHTSLQKVQRKKHTLGGFFWRYTGLAHDR